MELFEISKENLSGIETAILNTSPEEFDEIYSDDEFLFKIMEITKSRAVFIKCMDFILIPFLVEKIKNPETSLEMVFKLTLHPNSQIHSAILKRPDVTPELLKQLILNFKDEEILTSRDRTINHPIMDEETLYSLCDCNNNQILSQILLTDKVSDRILKKLQTSKDDEIRTMAEVRDPETNPEYIGKILRREFRNTIKVEDILGNRPTTIVTQLLPNDILEAGIKNPMLPTELVELYKKTSKLTQISLVIPHPNVSEELLDYYYKYGDEEVKEAVLKRRGEKEDHTI